MTKNNNLPQTYEVQYLQEEKIPTVEEIKKNGLSEELKKSLLDPRAKFDGDLVVFPLSKEEKGAGIGIGAAGAIGIGVLSFVCPPAGAAAAAACTLASTVANTVSYAAENEDAKDTGEMIGTMFSIASTGCPIGISANAMGGNGGKCIIPSHAGNFGH